MIEHRGRVTRRVLVPLMAMGTMTGGVLAVTATPAFAAMSAYACAYNANVSLFGGGYVSKGCVNTGGDATSLSPSYSGIGVGTTNDNDGAVGLFGPATIFSSPYTPSDSLNASGKLSVTRQIGASNGTVTAKADTVGPSPFFTLSAGYEPAWAEPAKPGGTTTHANTGGEQPQTMNGNGLGATWNGSAYVGSGTGYAYAQCTANSNGTETGTVIINQGVVDTHIISGGPNSGYPSESVAIPTVPSANYRVNYWIENVNDHGYIVFNERTTTGGALTVNAVHMYMQGNNAYGDLIIGQAVCGQ